MTATVQLMSVQGSDEVEPIDEVVARLDDRVARRLLAGAAEWHEDVMRAVRLAAAGESERLAVLKAAVDDGLRTRRCLDYWCGAHRRPLPFVGQIVGIPI